MKEDSFTDLTEYLLMKQKSPKLPIEIIFMAKDKCHFAVRKALEYDGWKITDDPYFIQVGKRRGYSVKLIVFHETENRILEWIP